MKQTLRKFYERTLQSRLMAYCRVFISSEKKRICDGMAIELTHRKCMKTKTVVAGLVTLAAALTTYMIIKRKNRKMVEPVHPKHHLTEVFSKAKSYAK